MILVVTVSLMILFSRLCHCLEREPRCYSNYDWHEKLLEKTIKTVLQMQEYLKAMEKVTEDIKVTKENLDEIKTSIEELKAKERVSSATITFNTRNAADLSPETNQIIIFSTVIQNIGDGYDRVTGIFTSPVNGTFIFNVQVCTRSSNDWAQFQLAVDRSNNIILTVSKYNGVTGSTTASNSVSHYLTKGQRVWVQSYYNSGSTSRLYNGDVCWNQFSGVFIHN